MYQIGKRRKFNATNYLLDYKFGLTGINQKFQNVAVVCKLKLVSIFSAENYKMFIPNNIELL